MDDILEIFADFERKTIRLVRDLLIRPALVLKSISSTSKTYTNPYRFYWTATSIVIILLFVAKALDHTNLWDVEEEMVLPPYWSSYLISLREFTLAIVPIYLFVITVPIMVISSMIVFWKPLNSFKKLAAYFTYLIGWCLLFYSFIMVITLPLSFFDLEASDLLSMLLIVLLLLVPSILLFRGCFELSGKRWLGLVQSFLVLGLTSTAAYFIWLPNDIEFLHDKIMYFNYDKVQLQTSPAHEMSTQFSESIELWSAPFTTSEKMVLFSDDWNLSGDIDSARQWMTMDENGRITIKGNLPEYAAWYSGLVDSHLIVLNYQYVYDPDKVYLTHKSHGIELMDSTQKDIPTQSVSKQMNNNLWISGVNGGVPTLSIFESGKRSEEYPIPLENSEIDDFVLNSNSVFLLASESSEDNLSEIYLHKMSIAQDGELIHQNRSLVNLPTANMPYSLAFNMHAHKIPQATISWTPDSSRLIVGYQLMHEKSFVQYMTMIDSASLASQWNQSYIFDADLTIFDNWQIVEGHIYLQGRAFSIFREGFSVQKNYNIFIQKIDLQDGSILEEKAFDPAITINFFNGVIYYDHPFFNVTDSLLIGFPDGDHTHHLFMERF